MNWAILLGLVTSASYFTPDEAQAVFAQANDAYYKQDYPAAKVGYLKLLETGMGGSDVLYNLGTNALAAGDLGEAVVFLERARRISRDDDIEANLTFARKQMVDQVVGAGAQEPFLNRLAHATDERPLAILFLASWWVGFLLLWNLSRVGRAKLWVGLLASVLLMVAVSSGSGVAIHAWVARTVIDAVVLPATAQVREFPGDSAKVAFEVHSGLKVRLMEESGKFARIRLPNGLEGWTELEGVTRL